MTFPFLLEAHVATAPRKEARRTIWRSWDHEPDEDLVEMPRTLALDLVKAISVSSFIFEAAEEDLEAGLHEKRLQAHRDHLEKVEGTITAHLGDEGLPVTPDVILRAMVMAYSTAPAIAAGL